MSRLCYPSFRRIWTVAKRIGSQFPGSLRHLGGNLCEADTLSRGQEVHLQPFRLQSYLIEQFLGIVHSAFGADITFQVMTCTFQSAGDEHGIRTLLERPQQVDDVHLPCAR